MKGHGFTLVEALVVLALGAGLAFLAAQSLVRGWLATKEVAEGGLAAQTLSQGLEYARQRLESRPTGVVVSAPGGVAVYQRWNTAPWIPIALGRGDTGYVLPEDPGGQDGDLYLLLDPGTGEAVLLVRQGLTPLAGGARRLETACASPFSGLAYLYRLYPVALAEGSALEGRGREDALYLSEGNGPWRMVAAGLSAFRVSARYRAADGTVRADPAGALLSEGVYAPYLVLEGKGYYLEDLLLKARAGSRDHESVAFLGHPVQAERVRALVACGSRGGAPPGPTGPAEGTLAVQVTGLPSGVAAQVRVTGPGGFARTLTASAELSVPPETYEVTAEPVTSGGVTFTPAVEGSPAQVVEGGRATVTVRYAQSGGVLSVRVMGYPEGAGTSRVSYRGTASGSVEYSASGTYSRSLPAGSYSLSVSPAYLRVGTDYYEARLSPGSAVVPEGGEATVTVSYQLLSSGVLHVVVRGLPQGVAASVRVTGLGGAVDERLTGSRDLVLPVDRTYTVTAQSVASGSAVYTPTPSFQTVFLPRGGEAWAYVDYTAGGTLRVEVSGLPQDPGRDVVRVYGPNTDALYQSLRATWEGQVPAGTYTVRADSVTLGSDAYVPTVEGSPARVDPGGRATVRVTYARSPTANLRILYTWSGVVDYSARFPVSLSGPASGTYLGAHSSRADEARYALPAGRYTVSSPLPGIPVLGQSNGIVSPAVEYYFYPCNYPTNNCRPTTGSGTNFTFDLPETGGTLLIPAVSYVHMQHFLGFYVRFCFPQDFANRTVTVSYRRRGYDGTNVYPIDATSQSLSLTLDANGCGPASDRLFERGDQNRGDFYGYRGFSLVFEDVTVDGNVYRPLLREVRGLFHAGLSGSRFIVHYRPISSPYAWYLPSLGWGPGRITGQATSAYYVRGRGTGEDLVYFFQTLSSGARFVGSSDTETSSSLLPQLYVASAYAYVFEEHVLAVSTYRLQGLSTPPQISRSVELNPGQVQSLGIVDVWRWQNNERSWRQGDSLVSVSLDGGSCGFGAVYVMGSADYTWWNFTLPPVMGQVRSGTFTYRLPPGTYTIRFHTASGCRNDFYVRRDRTGFPPQEYRGSTVDITLNAEDRLWITARY